MQVGNSDIDRASKHEFIEDEYKYTEHLVRLFPTMILPVFRSIKFVDDQIPGNKIYSYDDYVPTYRKPSVNIRIRDSKIIQDYIDIINKLSEQNLCYLDLKCSNICTYNDNVCILDNGPDVLYKLINDNLKDYYKLSGLLIGLLNLFSPRIKHDKLNSGEIQLLDNQGLTFTTAIDTFERRLSLSDINSIHYGAINEFYFINLNYVGPLYKTSFFKKMNDPYNTRLEYPLLLPNHHMNHYLSGNRHVLDMKQIIEWLVSIGITPPVHSPLKLPQMPTLPTPPRLPASTPLPTLLENSILNSMYANPLPDPSPNLDLYSESLKKKTNINK
jgi:hypothetical protein